MILIRIVRVTVALALLAGLAGEPPLRSRRRRTSRSTEERTARAR